MKKIKTIGENSTMKKLVTMMIALFAIIIMNVDADAQTRYTVKKYGYFDIAPLGGFTQPIGVFADVYKPSARVGLDMTYRVNKEVGIYGNVSYNDMQNKDESRPNTSFISAVVGPRYYFSHPNLSSQLFLEGGVGAYMFNTPAYSINGTDEPSSSETKVGVNAGIGGVVNLTNSMDIFVKSKYNTIFRDGGTSSFISTDGGVVFRF